MIEYVGRYAGSKPEGNIEIVEDIDDSSIYPVKMIQHNIDKNTLSKLCSMMKDPYTNVMLNNSHKEE